jgi:hypothetical protein
VQHCGGICRVAFGNPAWQSICAALVPVSGASGRCEAGVGLERGTGGNVKGLLICANCTNVSGFFFFQNTVANCQAQGFLKVMNSGLQKKTFLVK